jgi:hypothetical protein
MTVHVQVPDTWTRFENHRAALHTAPGKYAYSGARFIVVVPIPVSTRPWNSSFVLPLRTIAVIGPRPDQFSEVPANMPVQVIVAICPGWPSRSQSHSQWTALGSAWKWNPVPCRTRVPSVPTVSELSRHIPETSTSGAGDIPAEGIVGAAEPEGALAWSDPPADELPL